MLTVSLSFIGVDAILKKRGLENTGPIHNELNKMLLNYCEPYIPRKTGALIKSGGYTSSSLSWSAPYARKQYYQNKGSGSRGRLWFERMWASKKGEIMAYLNKFENKNAKKEHPWIAFLKERKIIK